MLNVLTGRARSFSTTLLYLLEIKVAPEPHTQVSHTGPRAEVLHLYWFLNQEQVPLSFHLYICRSHWTESMFCVQQKQKETARRTRFCLTQITNLCTKQLHGNVKGTRFILVVFYCLDLIHTIVSDPILVNISGLNINNNNRLSDPISDAKCSALLCGKHCHLSRGSPQHPGGEKKVPDWYRYQQILQVAVSETDINTFYWGNRTVNTHDSWWPRVLYIQGLHSVL